MPTGGRRWLWLPCFRSDSSKVGFGRICCSRQGQAFRAIRVTEPSVRDVRTQSGIALERQPRIPNCRGSKIGIPAAVAAGVHGRARPPGTEFLDAETAPLNRHSKARPLSETKNPRNEWPETPAKTLYWTSRRKRPVCGDWMVVCAVRYEPVSTPNSLIRPVLQGIFAKNCLFRESGPDFRSDDQRLSGEFPT